MQEETNKVLIGRIAALLAVRGRKLHRALALSSRTEELLDDVVRDLDDLQDMVRRSGALPPISSRAPGPLEAARQSRRLPRESTLGVLSVILVPRSDGSAAAHIDGRSGILLPPFVAALLEILKADGGIVNDHLAGWKSIAAIQSALKERTKQHHSKAAVKELVYRLRGLLERHGENPFLVQSNRRLGYRFAVKRGPGTMTERDNQ
jgi:hypothetical protein